MGIQLYSEFLFCFVFWVFCVFFFGRVGGGSGTTLFLTELLSPAPGNIFEPLQPQNHLKMGIIVPISGGDRSYRKDIRDIKDSDWYLVRAQ